MEVKINEKKKSCFKLLMTNTSYPIVKYTQKLKLLHKINIPLGIRHLLTIASFCQREIQFSLSAPCKFTVHQYDGAQPSLYGY